ncbi:MAG: sigma-E processing peptidase SpoIIGA [Clostridia bacterium]
MLGALIGTIVIVIAFRISKNRITKKDMLCKTKIKLGKNEITLNTMLDTGNLLKEPISGNPVIVVEKNRTL